MQVYSNPLLPGATSKATNSWAVQITSGGKRAADELASKYGFINLGPVRLAKICWPCIRLIVVLQIDDDPNVPENEQVYEFVLPVAKSSHEFTELVSF